jgi:hypothetical protein
LARQAQAYYGVSAEGNFEHGASALWREEPLERVAQRLGVDAERLRADMELARTKLLAARRERAQPARDDKVLAAWNGLMVSALAQAYQVLGDSRWLALAQRALGYVLGSMRQPDGRLRTTARAGRAQLNAYLDDYAFVIQACIDLYESDFDLRWLHAASSLETVVAERFEDATSGGFFTTGSDHERLLARLKSPQDGALPSGNGVMALNLLRLAELTGERALAARAERTLLAYGELANRYPAAFSSLLLAADFLAAEPLEIVVAGALEDERTCALLACVRSSFRPQRVVAAAARPEDATALPLLAGRSNQPGPPRAYVCRNFRCDLPVDSPEALAAKLQ